MTVKMTNIETVIGGPVDRLPLNLISETGPDPRSSTPSSIAFGSDVRAEVGLDGMI